MRKNEKYYKPRKKTFTKKLNPFSTNVPLRMKPGSWFLPAKCLKNNCGRVTFQVKMQVIDLHLYVNVTLTQVFFKYFTSKNQLPGLSVNSTLVENGLMLQALAFYHSVEHVVILECFLSCRQCQCPENVPYEETLNYSCSK